MNIIKIKQLNQAMGKNVNNVNILNYKIEKKNTKMHLKAIN